MEMAVHATLISVYNVPIETAKETGEPSFGIRWVDTWVNSWNYERLDPGEFHLQGIDGTSWNEGDDASPLYVTGLTARCAERIAEELRSLASVDSASIVVAPSEELLRRQEQEEARS